MKQVTLLVVLATLLLGGCASRQATDEQVQQNEQQGNQNTYTDPRDPLEGINREIWDFNYNVLDKHIVRPIAVAYVDYMPGFARTGLYNMALNLEEPANTLNNLFQGKVGDSLSSLGRFLINSTIGLLGAFDVADEIGLKRKEEDFGETLGVWGVDTGPYLMLPAMGPNDVRSGVGDVVDSSYFPLADLNIYFSVLRIGVNALEARAALLEQERLLEQSLDPYIFVRDAYFQNLMFQVLDGNVPEPVEEDPLDDEDIDALLDEL